MLGSRGLGGGRRCMVGWWGKEGGRAWQGSRGAEDFVDFGLEVCRLADRSAAGGRRLDGESVEGGGWGGGHGEGGLGEGAVVGGRRERGRGVGEDGGGGGQWSGVSGQGSRQGTLSISGLCGLCRLAS